MLHVLRHGQFKKLWIAQLISGTGDWLNRVALLGLIARLGGGEAALGGLGAMYAGELVARFLPDALTGPLAGPVADRVSRKAVMIAADLVNAILALGYFLVRDAASVKWIYPLIVAQMVGSMFFHSARQAALTGVVPREELHQAMALTSLTWSAVLSIGAVLGGLLTAALGPYAVFVIDSATYVASAAILTRVVLPPMPQHPEPFSWRRILLLEDMRAAFRHARARRLLPALSTKVFWGAVGGYLVMLSVVGVTRFGDGDGSAAVGWLYGARGVGTGFGPLLANRIFGASESGLRRQISVAFVVAAVGYAFFAEAEGLLVACSLVTLAHLGGSTLWTGSTVWLQREVDDAYRGRIFALDFFGMTIACSAGAVLAGLLYDRTQAIDITIWTLSAIVLVCGGIWTYLAARTVG